ncbi:11725_t:CDS:2 [Acaulospora colombiana]|uniref:11725_t:CDS:1 n=1 Tax=Acaulospora colombiana TaxID=27376 RepID=A0ACA9MPF9_9GLOM|nr:11725_t:CDS:2 [Acaulospora colombiana]
MNAITPEGKAKLFELDIGAVFDFRDDREIRREARLPADADPVLGLPELKRPKPGEINVSDDLAAFGQGQYGEIPVIRNPLKDITEYTPQETMKLITRMGRGDDGMVELYIDFLNDGGKSFGNIMRFLLKQAKRDTSQSTPEEQDTNAWHGTACLVHCHSRSSLSFMDNGLTGVPDSVIAHDYALTRIGLEPMRSILENQFKDLKAVNQEAAATFGSSRTVVMMRFLEALKTKYGGARGYFKEYSGLTDDELDIIRNSLVVSKKD